jgi:hypothetical protein
MVRSLLHSSLLQRSSGLRFALLFLGICVLLASVPLWFGMADFDYHFSYDRTLRDPSFYQQTQTSPYGQLLDENKRVVDAALAGKTFEFEDDTKNLPEIVRKDGVYRKFNARRTIDWTYPGTLGPTVLGFMGLWIIIESIQHERKYLGPRGY